MGNEGLYSISKGMWKGTLKIIQVESFAGHSWLLSREVTREIHSNKDSSNSSMCFSRGLLWVATREIVVNSSSSQNLHQALTHSPYIKSHKSTRKWLNKNTIKFDTE